MKPVHHQTSDYLQFWGLQVSPFLQRDPDRFFSGSAQRNALSLFEQFIESGEPVAMLVGEPGCGMTRIFEHLSRQSGVGDCAVEMVTARESPTASQDVRTVWLRDQDDRPDVRLLQRRSTGVSLVVGVAERQRKSMIAIFGHYPWTIELASMSLEDAQVYVSFAIRMAGGNQSIFTASAIEQLHERSEGRIREFSRLAENALRESWSLQKAKVGPESIERAEDRVRRAG